MQGKEYSWGWSHPYHEMTHAERMAEIQAATAQHELVAIISLIVAVILIWALIWVAVGNWTKPDPKDNFERKTPPPIDWNKVE